jgi:hypothetical protein
MFLPQCVLSKEEDYSMNSEWAFLLLSLPGTYSSGLSWRVLISTSQVEARVRARMLRKIGNPFAAREQLRRMRHPEVTQVVNETLEQSRRGDQRCHSQQTRGERITTSDLQH